MSKPKVVLVKRKLQQFDTVVSRVVVIPENIYLDEVAKNHFCEEAMNDERKRLENNFKEFRQAEWSYEIMEVDNR